MRKRESIRLRNLERLVEQAGSATTLARLAQTSDSYLSQIRRGLPTQLGTRRAVGDDLAGRLERAMGKPEGWMDEEHLRADEDPPSGYLSAHPGAGERPERYPLIAWADAARWSTRTPASSTDEAEDWLPCPVACSAQTFILTVEGESMAPKFLPGDLLFVDPHVAPEGGRFVIVRQEPSAELALRQLIIEGGREYVKALNPDWPSRVTELSETASICGVVIFKGERL